MIQILLIMYLAIVWKFGLLGAIEGIEENGTRDLPWFIGAIIGAIVLPLTVAIMLIMSKKNKGEAKK